MAATNSILCSSCSAHNLLSRPPLSSLVSRRSLLRSPFMSVDNSAPSSSILGPDVIGNPLILLSETQPPDSSTGGSQSPEKDAGRLNLSFSSLANAPTWTKLVMGVVVLLAIPIFGKLLRTEGMLKKVEEVEKVVETAAEAVEKITKDIAEVLPEGETKEEVLKLGRIAFLVDKNAEALEYIIDKIDEEVEEIEAESKAIEGDRAKKNDAGDNMKTAIDLSHEKGVKGSGPDT